MKLSMMTLAAACAVAGMGDETPHWIGLEQTNRAADSVATTVAVATHDLDTRLQDEEDSSGVTIYGTKYRGLCVFIR